VILARALERVSHVIEVDLSCNLLTSFGGIQLLKVLNYNESIISLNLSSKKGLNRNTLGAAGMEPLEQILLCNKTLCYLNVAGNFIGDEGLGYICRGLIVGENKNLVSLNISLNEITSEGCEKLREAIPKTNLKQLDISSNPI